MHTTSRQRFSLVALVATLVVPAFVTPAAAAGGGGGGGSGGEYSDLVVALRDVDGLPILREFVVTDETGTTTEYCVQPVSYDPLPRVTESVTNEVDGREVYLIPLVGDLDEPSTEEAVEVCDPQPAYAMYVAEAELERLNMARTNEEVLARKLQDVTERLLVADEVTLDGAGRLVIDGAVVDAGPENAALFQELIATGTLPTLDPAVVPPFGPWELSAAAVGAAASKFTPVSIDAVLYYNRITDAAPSDGWRADPLVLEETGEEFVNYRGFSYTRADVFAGGVTWLDVPSLTWKTTRILDSVDFAPLPPNAVGGTLENAAGYAQLVDDVRAAILYFHQYEALTGFFMDPVGVDTYDQQVAALTAPAMRMADVPAQVVQTETFAGSASILNPWAGSSLDDVRPRVRLETAGGFTAGDAALITATEVASGDPITFELEGDALVGYWEPAPGITVAPGDNVTTALEMRVGAGAPVALYDLRVEMVQGTDVLASASTSVDVLAPEVTAMWTAADRYVEQAAYAQLVTRTFNPAGSGTLTGAQLQLTVEPLVTGGFPDVPSQAVLYSDATAIPLVRNAEGQLQGVLTLADLAEESTVETTWFLVVAEGAPIGWYDLSVQVLGGAAPQTVGMYVAPAPIHGPGDTAPNAPTAVTAVAGDGAAVVSWTAAVDGGAVSGFVVESSPGDVTCVAWGASATSCTVSPLTNGTSYTFRVKAVGEGGFSSPSAPSAPVIPSRCGPPPATGPFSDVGGTHPFCADIEWLADRGVTSGFADGTFRPGATVTRQSLAAFLYRYSGSPAFTPPATPTFTDVPAGHSFFLEIEWLASTDITGGYADGTYRPHSSVTRQSMAAFMYRLADEPAFTPPATPSFTDVGTTHAFYAEIEWFVDADITAGFADDTYRPGHPVTRQAYAAFQHRYDQLPD